MGYVEASFTILETITCLKGGVKYLGVFLTFLKLFGLMVYKSNYLQNLELKGECGEQ